MTEEENDYSPSAAADDGALGRRRRRKTISLWRPSLPRWIPTSTDRMIAAEKRLLSLVKTPYTQEQVNIGRSLAGLRKKRRRRRLFKPATIRRNGVGKEEEEEKEEEKEEEEERFINTITFINNEENSREGEEGTTPAPTLVMLHGHGAPVGVFFRNFDSLAKHFTVIAIDQLGYIFGACRWGRSSRPNVTCKNTQESDAWFIDSFEEWRKAKNLTNFILLGHSLGGYVAAKYALQHPQHVKHLILVGPVGFTYDDTPFESSLIETVLDYLWISSSRFTQHNLIRALGPFGPRMGHKCIVDEIGDDVLNEEESKCFAALPPPDHLCPPPWPSSASPPKPLAPIIFALAPTATISHIFAP
ncbi:hypothetical protein DM860_006514 [Cuscuta australis]|uniref:AB hydrolase-1 domain-containing protein n=1 Tax=Cuscuta australis TaxID=267555 RepID=A0A328D4W0_9ASTE|nr:hypothetical protein DM860_006514 [Cuscuta australis]